MKLSPFIILSFLFAPLAHANFSDISATSPYADAINYVQEEGIVSGYPDGTFRPDDEINRAEFTKIVVGSAYTLKDAKPSGKALFRDVKGTEWFAPYIEKAVDEGIVQGYSSGGDMPRTATPFYPTFRINFAEAAKIITLSERVVFEPTLANSNEPWWEAYINVLRSQNALPKGWEATKTVTRGEMAEMIYRMRTQKQSTQAEPTKSTRSTSMNIPILVYHHVREQEGWSHDTWSWKMTVAPSFFEKHLQHMVAQGYTSIDLDSLVAIMEGRMAGPLKPVVLTFDDNNLNAYEAGVPLMEKYGITATFYQIADKLDSATTIDREKTLDLLRRGFDIQSHTMTHRVLTGLSVEQMDWELKESKRILEELTGKPINHVAYPGTAHNATVRERTKLAGYVTGTLMDPRYVTEGADYYKLPRIMMTDETNLSKVLP